MNDALALAESGVIAKSVEVYTDLIAASAVAREPDVADRLLNEMRWDGMEAGAHAWSAALHAQV